MSASLETPVFTGLPIRDERFLSATAWGVAFAIFLMFTGMMHDFRSTSISQDQLHEDMRDARQEFNSDVSKALPERKLAFMLSGLIGLFCWATANKTGRWESKLAVSLIVLGLVWASASILWSQSPSLTARSLFRVFVYAFLCYGLTLKFSALELIKIVVVASTLSVGIAVFTEVFIGSPEDIEDVYRLSGSMHPNSLSRFAAIVAIPAFAFAWWLPRQRVAWVTLLTLSMVVIHLSRCRTSLGSALVGIAVLWLLNFGWKRAVAPIAISLTLLGFGFLTLGAGGRAVIALASNTAAMGRVESVSTLTGRLPLWDVLLRKASERPMIGYGYGGFWDTRNTDAIQKEVGWQAGHSHNCYIEILVNVGAIGLMIFLLLGTVCFLRSAKIALEQNLGTYAILAAIVASAAVNALTEVGFVLPREHAIILALLAFIIARGVDNEDSNFIIHEQSDDPFPTLSIRETAS
jgi:exopolysaccharide production protein ExoQ